MTNITHSLMAFRCSVVAICITVVTPGFAYSQRPSPPQVVENRGAGLWKASDAWRAIVDLTIGTATGRPEEEFGLVSDVAAASDGSICVFDQMAGQIRVFDAAGRFLRAIGRKGRGPGEFGPSAGEIVIGANDTIFVPDVSNQRIHLFRLDGQFVGELPFARFAGNPMPWRLVGNSLVYRRYTPRDWDGLVQFDRFGVEGRRIQQFTRALAAAQVQTIRTQDPFTTTYAWTALDGNRIAFGSTDRYEFTTISADGTPERITRKLEPRHAVSNRDRTTIQELWKERVRQRLQGLPVSAEVARAAASANQIVVPDSLPAFADMTRGPVGTMWVQKLSSPAEMDPEALGAFDLSGLGGLTWDVFDSSGRFLGEVKFPVRVRIMDARDDYFYGLTKGELDEARIVRIKVVRPRP